MDNSIYIVLSKQTAQLREMDLRANNIANSATTGFQDESMLFTQYLVDDGNRHKMAFARDIASYRDTDSGPVKATGNQFDVAIRGPGYFTVQTPLGTRYTKAGNFQLDASKTLVTQEGYPVLDRTGQKITFEEDDEAVRIGDDGTVFAINREGDVERATLGVAEFANQQLLERTAGALFKGENPLPPAQSHVLQGVLEQSNVKPIIELTGVLNLSRSIGHTGKFIETVYDLERKASNSIAKQNA